MGKASKRKRTGKKEIARPIPRSVPNWPLLGLALLGMGLTAYLTLVYWRGQALAGCPVGSGCDIVLNSRWSKLFGLPTSFWGFLTYSSLAGIAWIKSPVTHWKWAWSISLFGALYSLYLTSVSFLELDAACPYCLLSAGLFLVIGATVFFQRPKDLPRFSWPAWSAKTLAAGAAVVLAIHLHYAGVWGKSAREDPYLHALAEHLKRTDAKFYGAYWCSHCVEQKQMFGPSGDELPYVECSPLGPKARQASVCEAQRIDSYPTWIIKGQRYPGVQTPSDLARHSGYSGKDGK